MFAIIVGGVFIIIGIVFIFIQKSQEKNLFTIKAIPKRTIGELSTMAKEITSELGEKGSYKEAAKVWGTLESDSPLRSEFTNTACAWYQSQITRRYEEEKWETDNSGNKKRVLVTHEETVSNIERESSVYINDGTGKALVNLKGCQFDRVEVMNEFHPGSPDQSTIRIGSFSLNLAGLTHSHRTLGYRYEEKVLPINRSALVIGAISDSDSSGILKFKKPSESQYSYLLSLKSEDDLIDQTSKSIKTSKIVSLVTFILGGLGLIAGVIMIAMGV